MLTTTLIFAIGSSPSSPVKLAENPAADFCPNSPILPIERIEDVEHQTPTRLAQRQSEGTPISCRVDGEGGLKRYLEGRGFFKINIREISKNNGAQHKGQLFIKCYDATDQIYEFFGKILADSRENAQTHLNMRLSDQQNFDLDMHKNEYMDLSEKYQKAFFHICKTEHKLCLLLDRVKVVDPETERVLYYVELFPTLPEGQNLFQALKKKLDGQNYEECENLKDAFWKAGVITGYLTKKGAPHCDCILENFWYTNDGQVIGLDFRPHHFWSDKPSEYDPPKRMYTYLAEIKDNLEKNDRVNGTNKAACFKQVGIYFFDGYDSVVNDANKTPTAYINQFIPSPTFEESSSSKKNRNIFNIPTATPWKKGYNSDSEEEAVPFDGVPVCPNFDDD